MSPDHETHNSFEQMHAAAAWAALKIQCPLNYENLREDFATKDPAGRFHTRRLNNYLKQVSGRQKLTSLNYDLWLLEALCTNQKHHQHGDLTDAQKAR